MNTAIKEALDRGGIADITTTGRKTGKPRRIEIYFHHFDDAYYLTGQPRGPRDWEANIRAKPGFILHLKGNMQADVPVIGETDLEVSERRRVIERARVENWGHAHAVVESEMGLWVERSPFVRFTPAV